MNKERKKIKDNANRIACTQSALAMNISNLICCDISHIIFQMIDATAERKQ